MPNVHIIRNFEAIMLITNFFKDFNELVDFQLKTTIEDKTKRLKKNIFKSSGNKKHNSNLIDLNLLWTTAKAMMESGEMNQQQKEVLYDYIRQLSEKYKRCNGQFMYSRLIVAALLGAVKDFTYYYERIKVPDIIISFLIILKRKIPTQICTYINIYFFPFSC